MIIIIFIVLLIVSPFIYLQLCPLCKKRPQNMLYLTGCYAAFLCVSLAYPQFFCDSLLVNESILISGRSLMCFFLLLLSLEGMIILRYRRKKASDPMLEGIYQRSGTVLTGIAIISAISIIVMLIF